MEGGSGVRRFSSTSFITLQLIISCVFIISGCHGHLIDVRSDLTLLGDQDSLELSVSGEANLAHPVRIQQVQGSSRRQLAGTPTTSSAPAPKTSPPPPKKNPPPHKKSPPPPKKSPPSPKKSPPPPKKKPPPPKKAPPPKKSPPPPKKSPPPPPPAYLPVPLAPFPVNYSAPYLLQYQLLNTLYNKSYTETATALYTTGAVDILAENSPTALFAPSNAAYHAIPANYRALLDDPVNGPNILFYILLYHTVNTNLTYDMIIAKGFRGKTQLWPTLLSSSPIATKFTAKKVLSISPIPPLPSIPPAKIPKGQIFNVTSRFSSCMVFGIDQVLLPPIDLLFGVAAPSPAPAGASA